MEEKILKGKGPLLDQSPGEHTMVTSFLSPMDFFALLEAMILGTIQGFTEFLPISSSGHLALFPWLFGWQTPGLVFDTSLHLGTSIALLLFFYKDFLHIIKGFLTPRSTEAQAGRKLGYLIIIGMLPAGVVGLLFDNHIETFFKDPMGNLQVFLIATSLMLFGIILWLADRYGNHKKTITDLRWKDALIIGFFQILALFPGTSRSGITMTAGMGLGFSREMAARFSFLVGAPLTFAAGLFKLKDLQGMILTPDLIGYFLSGILVSALSGYLCIRFFLSFLKKHPVTVFTIYRLAFGLFILTVLFLRF